jgi:hypothetical protein
MLIYEKDNKLNINFENSVNESPDLQIGKSGDKTEVLIDGQPGGGSGGGTLVCHLNGETGTLDKTWAEIKNAALNGLSVIVIADSILPGNGAVNYAYLSGVEWKPVSISGPIVYSVRFFLIINGAISEASFSTDSEDGYPVMEH